MTHEQQPEALRVADEIDPVTRKSLDNITCAVAAIHLRAQHARIAHLESELARESARTADEKLRADQMTEQHRMQCAMRRDLEAQPHQHKKPEAPRSLVPLPLIEAINDATGSNEWQGDHGQDALLQPACQAIGRQHTRIAELVAARDAALDVAAMNARSGAAYAARVQELEAQLEAIGAGGVEPMRARQCLHQIAEPGGWIVVADRLPEITELCDWLMPPTELKRERWILVNECLVTASVPGAATHWRKTQPLPPSPSSAEGGSQ